MRMCWQPIFRPKGIGALNGHGVVGALDDAIGDHRIRTVNQIEAVALVGVHNLDATHQQIGAAVGKKPKPSAIGNGDAGDGDVAAQHQAKPLVALPGGGGARGQLGVAIDLTPPGDGKIDQILPQNNASWKELWPVS